MAFGRSYIEGGECRLVSRNGNQFRSFAALNEWLSKELSARSAVPDGEIVCLSTITNVSPLGTVGKPCGKNAVSSADLTHNEHESHPSHRSREVLVYFQISGD